MKGKILLVLLLSVIMLASCSSDAPTLMPESDTSIPAAANLIGREKAIDIAGKYRQSMFANTRVLPAVKSIELINSAKTRNGDGEASYYIINYENDGGFAIVDAKPQENPLYAISEEGSVSIKDTVENKGLAMFFRNMEVQSSGIVPVDPSKPSFDSTLYDLVKFPTLTTTCEPQLSAQVRSWGQDSPYNSQCPAVFIPASYWGGTDYYRQGVVGCVALSTAQILSYHRYPAQIGNLPLDWNAVNSYEGYLTYGLLARLGSSDYLNLTYGYDRVLVEDNKYKVVLGTYCKFSEAPSRIISTVKKLGYNTPSINAFTELGARTALDKGPILILSKMDGIFDQAHAWVMDGYKHTQFEYSDPATAERKKGETFYFHCVWGWNGNANGYYKLSNGAIEGTVDSNKFKAYEMRYMSNFQPN